MNLQSQTLNEVEETLQNQESNNKKNVVGKRIFIIENKETFWTIKKLVEKRNKYLYVIKRKV